MLQNRRHVLAKEMPVACLRHVVCQTETELQFDGFFVPLMTRSLSYETATEQASLPIAIVHTEREGSVCFSFFLYHGIPAGCITQKECECLFVSCLPCCPFWKGRSGKKSHGLSDESDWWMNVDDSDHLLLENCPFCSHFPTRVLGAVREGGRSPSRTLGGRATERQQHTNVSRTLRAREFIHDPLRCSSKLPPANVMIAFPAVVSQERGG